MRGFVKYFDERRGFGAIKPSDDSPEVFCHVSSLRELTEKVLVHSEEVEFQLEEGDRGPQATGVIRLDLRKSGIVATFENGYGFITPTDGGDKIFVHHSDIAAPGFKRLEPHEEVTYVESETDRGPKAIRVRRLDTLPPLEKYARLPSFVERIDELAIMAQKENWDYRHTKSSHDKPVLRSYLYQTFARRQEEGGKIAEARDKNGRCIACINTGLATERQEAIYALFSQAHDKSESEPAAPKWALSGFKKESDRSLLGFEKLPELANYFQEPGELLYDSRMHLTVKHDHVIGENRQRFPEEFLDNEVLIRNVLDGAIQAAKHRVRRNYKTAIPQFYRGSLQLLLPLCLVGKERADLALVVAREGKVYMASTVLTLDMAYNNARLLARPDTEWLDP